MIYEQYWDAEGGCAPHRHSVHKLWNGDTLYFSEVKNLENQLARLKKTFCDGGLCKLSEQSKRRDAYRLPYCAALLRPTDKLQSQNSKLVSTGIHVPVCVVNRFSGGKNEVKKLERNHLRGESLSQMSFGELFNYNMCGSRWLTFKELRQFCEAHDVVRERDTISILAQEFGVPEKKDFPARTDRRRKGRRSK